MKKKKKKENALLQECTPPSTGCFRMHITSLCSRLADERTLLLPTETYFCMFPQSGAVAVAAAVPKIKPSVPAASARGSALVD